MERGELLRTLGEAPALRMLPAREREVLLDWSSVCTFAAGETLMEEGAPLGDAYLLLRGRVAVVMRLGEGETHRIATREGVVWVGESALLDRGVRSATVIAETPVEALRVPQKAFVDLMAGDAPSVLDLLRSEIRRLRESDNQLVDVLRRRIRTLRSEKQRLSLDNRRLRSALYEKSGFESFVGTGGIARTIREEARHAAESDVPILLLGETGTGKELVARAIHAAGPRSERPFVALNCALITEPLLESELFGHARGAFTGASEAKRGLVEEAEGGTLFLDEVVDMSPALQGALLRFLELGEFRRLGETRLRSARVRVITATQIPLERAVRNGRFRADLLYRLDVMAIQIPPLRDRSGDIPLLVAHYVDRVAERLGVAPLRMRSDTIEALSTYDFPGNVRELENEIERLYALLEPGSLVTPTCLKPKITSSTAASGRHYREAVRSFKAGLVERALLEAGGNRTRAAELLGVHRSNLVRMVREFGVGEPLDAAVEA